MATALSKLADIVAKEVGWGLVEKGSEEDVFEGKERWKETTLRKGINKITLPR
jgi:hypothetical protein